MLSKEEIEKAKEKTSTSILLKQISKEVQEATEIIIKKSNLESISGYTIEQLTDMFLAGWEIKPPKDDKKIQELKKGQNSLMSSRKKWKDRYYKLKSILNKEKGSAYWKGYITKQQEAMEICKICKYKKQYFEKKVEEK